MANGTGAGIGGAVAGGLLGFGVDLFRGIQAKRQQTRFRRRQRRAIGEARDFASQTVANITGSPLFQQGEQFLSGLFGNASGSPLVQDFGKQLRAAQATRGLLRSAPGAEAEAGAVALAGQRLRQDLLPQLLQFATTPEQLRQSVLSQEVGLRVASATGAPLPGFQQPQAIDPFGTALQSAIQGAAGGFQLGSEFGRGNEREETEAETIERLLGNRNTLPIGFVGGLNPQVEAALRRLQARRR